MIKVEFDPKFHGPSAAELEPILGDIADNPVKVRWLGTKEEVRVMGSYPRDFVVCVNDANELVSVSCTLGAPLTIDNKEMAQAKDALANKKAYNWRKLAGELGPAKTRAVVVKLAANAIRQGLKPRLADVAADILLGKANPTDADVLMRLRNIR